MSKPSREPALHAGEAQLKEWGLGPDAGVESLLTCAGRAGTADLAIAHRLGALVSAESASALLALEAASIDKLVHKEIRRALYRLEQQGVKSAKPVETAKAFVMPTQEGDIEGYLSPHDGRGDQLLWIVKPQSGGLLQMFAVVNDPHGLREVFAAEVSRKQLRAANDDLFSKHEIRMVDADWRFCDFAINRALGWAQTRNQPVHGDYRGLRIRFSREPVTEIAPPIYTLLDAGSVAADPQWLRESGALMEEKEFRTWFFPPDELGSYLDEVFAMKDSPIVLSELQQKERFAQVIERAVVEIFGGENQAGWVRRFETMAYVLHKTNRATAAKQSLAVALALKSSPHGGREIPYCEIMTRSCMATYWQMNQKEEAAERTGSLVLTPGEAAREADTRRRQ